MALTEVSWIAIITRFSSCLTSVLVGSISRAFLYACTIRHQGGRTEQGGGEQEKPEDNNEGQHDVCSTWKTGFEHVKRGGKERCCTYIDGLVVLLHVEMDSSFSGIRLEVLWIQLQAFVAVLQRERKLAGMSKQRSPSAIVPSAHTWKKKRRKRFGFGGWDPRCWMYVGMTYPSFMYAAARLEYGAGSVGFRLIASVYLFQIETTHTETNFRECRKCTLCVRKTASIWYTSQQLRSFAAWKETDGRRVRRGRRGEKGKAPHRFASQLPDCLFVFCKGAMRSLFSSPFDSLRKLSSFEKFVSSLSLLFALLFAPVRLLLLIFQHLLRLSQLIVHLVVVRLQK